MLPYIMSYGRNPTSLSETVQLRTGLDVSKYFNTQHGQIVLPLTNQRPLISPYYLNLPVASGVYFYTLQSIATRLFKEVNFSIEWPFISILMQYTRDIMREYLGYSKITGPEDPVVPKRDIISRCYSASFFLVRVFTKLVH